MAGPQARLATAADLPQVAALGLTIKPEVSALSEGEDELLIHLSAYLSSGGQIFVADLHTHKSDPQQIEGFAFCRTIEPMFFARERSVVVDALFVTPTARRHGVGGELMHAVAQFASEIGSPFVYATPAAAERGMHRFLARLGFAPAAGQRIVATTTLLRKLQPEDPVTQAIALRAPQRNPARASIQDVVAKRKRARNLETGQISVVSPVLFR